MEKWKVIKKNLSHLGYLNFFFYRNACLLSSPLCSIKLLSKLLNLIGCQGDRKLNF